MPLTQPHLLEHANTQILWQICNGNHWDWVKFQGCPKTFFHCCRLVSFLVGIFCCDLNKTTWKASNLLSGAAMSEPEPTGAAVQFHRQDSTSKSKIWCRAEQRPPPWRRLLLHIRALYSANVPVGTVSCQHFDHRGENRHDTDITLADTIFALCAGRVHWEGRNRIKAFIFFLLVICRFCHSERRVDNLNGRKSLRDPWPPERSCLWKLLKTGLFFYGFCLFFPLNLYKRHTWIWSRRLPLLLMPSFIWNLFFSRGDINSSWPSTQIYPSHLRRRPFGRLYCLPPLHRREAGTKISMGTSVSVAAIK